MSKESQGGRSPWPSTPRLLYTFGIHAFRETFVCIPTTKGDDIIIRCHDQVSLWFMDMTRYLQPLSLSYKYGDDQVKRINDNRDFCSVRSPPASLAIGTVSLDSYEKSSR
jgi:hypothetical protein